MRMKVNRIWDKKQVPEDWPNRVLVLWQEDECLRSDPSAEHIADVVVRFAGNMYDCANHFEYTDDEYIGVKRKIPNPMGVLGEPLAEDDSGGDEMLTLYRHGWVVGHTPEGSFFGVLLK